jgi:hypothetical protein
MPPTPAFDMAMPPIPSLAGASLPAFAMTRIETVKTEVHNAEPVTESKSLKVWDVPVDLIDPNVDNPNEMDEETFNVLAEEIDEQHEGSPGFIEPIHLVRLNNGRFQLVGGEHRWRAVKALGRKTIPALIFEGGNWDKEEFREFMLFRLNHLRGSLNTDKFLKLYQKHAEKYGNEQLQRLYAFTDKDYWASLTGGTKQALKDMGMSQEMLNDFDEKSKEVKTVDDLASILNGLFSKYGNDLRYNFMVFVFGGKEHLMIRMDKEMTAQMEKVKRFCRDNQIDVNLLFKPVVSRIKDFAEDPETLARLKSTGEVDGFK